MNTEKQQIIMTNEICNHRINPAACLDCKIQLSFQTGIKGTSDWQIYVLICSNLACMDQ